MNAKIIQLPKIFDERGNLSFVEEMIHIPFANDSHLPAHEQYFPRRMNDIPTFHVAHEAQHPAGGLPPRDARIMILYKLVSVWRIPLQVCRVKGFGAQNRMEVRLAMKGCASRRARRTSGIGNKVRY